jgi:DNA polymerase-3 subunit gamma/tau
MSYIALARKWRPRTFLELVGQEHINKALLNSLNQQRLHHAYLFTGTRGVGKTSIARLLAKALNCEIGVSSTPCLQCDACSAIEQSRFIDLIEIDGASRTRVEDTREILENVQYAPSSGRFKIYLIDEVHMLSQHSFNALLKTLEEPPAHVKFLLATTDPQKLPVTVLSRCLQFNLKPISPEIISKHLQHILEIEELTHEPQALELIAKAARGSMRDALSLLDQAIAMGDDSLTAQTISSVLGYTQQDYALRLLQALAEFDAQTLITLSREIAQEGGNFQYTLEEMLNYLHQILLHQNLPNTSPFINTRIEVAELANKFTPEDTHLFYQIALKGIDEIQLAPTLSIGFEITLLRMYAFKPVTNFSIPELAHQTVKQYEDVKKLPDSEVLQVQRDPGIEDFSHETTEIGIISSENAPEDISVEDTSAASSLEQFAGAVESTSQPNADQWSQILHHLNLSGLALSAAENTEFVSKEGKILSLKIATGHQSVFTPTVISRIEQALSLYYKEEIKLHLNSKDSVNSTPALKKKISKEKQRHEAELALTSDAFFQKLQQEFSGEVIKNSITPIEDDL